jgi:hypothetical protein
LDILRLLDSSGWIDGYEIQEYRRWADGFYRKIKIVFADQSDHAHLVSRVVQHQRRSAHCGLSDCKYLKMFRENAYANVY